MIVKYNLGYKHSEPNVTQKVMGIAAIKLAKFSEQQHKLMRSVEELFNASTITLH